MGMKQRLGTVEAVKPIELPQQKQKQEAKQASLPSFDNSHKGKWFEYIGKAEKLQKQWSGVKLQVLSDDGAFAYCKGDNGQYYTWVPLDNCREVTAPIATSASPGQREVF